MSRLATRKYQVLLVALLGLVVFFPILGSATETRLLLDLCFSFVFVAAFVVIFAEHRFQLVAVLLGVPTLIGLWTGYFLPDIPRTTLGIGFHLVAALFFVFTIVMLLRNIHREPGVSADSVYGAFCGYLMVGLAFGHLFSLVELLAPGSFRGDAFTPQMPDDRRHFLLTYFSFITLATVGYGDITPSSDPARGLAVVEAIIGQFYIAVLVAALIGKYVGQAFAPPEK